MLKKPVHILMIDDDASYCNKVVDHAKKHRLLVTHCQNLEDGLRILGESRKYKAAILDDRCILNEKQDPGSGKSNFVTRAIIGIKAIESKQDICIPFCVTAINPEEFYEDMEGTTVVFQKHSDTIEMFEYIIKQLWKLPEIKIREKHSGIFSFAEDYFSNNDIELLEELLINEDQSDYPAVVTNLGMLRRIEESLFDLLASTYYGKNPSDMKIPGMGITRSVIHQLAQDSLLPKYLEHYASNIYQISSKYGSHKLRTHHQGNEHLPGHYTVSSLVNALFELMDWAGELLDE